MSDGLKCEICGYAFSSFQTLSVHIKHHNITKQDYYDKFFKKENEGICPICNNQTSFVNIKSGYRIYCSHKCNGLSEESTNKYKQSMIKKYGVEHPMQSKSIKDKIDKTMLEKYGTKCPLKSEKIKKKFKQTNLDKYGTECSAQNKDVIKKMKQTNLDRYGVEYSISSNIVKDKIKKTFNNNYKFGRPLKSEKIKEKMRQTNLDRYGVENTFQCDIFKEKIKQTNLDRYGYSRPLKNEKIKEKMRQTNLDKYSVEYVMQFETFREKMRQTNLDRYGVENVMHNSEIQIKAQQNSFKSKEYIFSSGRIDKVQGYEPWALDILINEGYKEDNILTQPKMEVWYFNKNKKHRYYPDIYIKSENKIIEVKSTYTYIVDYEINQLKKQACLDLEYKFEFWIFDDKRNFIDEKEINNGLS